MKWSRETIIRVAISLIVLLSGLMMAPFIDVPTESLGWETFAGIYTPELTVNQSSGSPGSVFTFTGSNYPANSMATVYVDGEAVGEVTTDGSGSASFLLNTIGALPGLYNVTMEVDANASATQSIELDAGEPLVPPPAGSPGPTFFFGNPVFLPLLSQT